MPVVEGRSPPRIAALSTYLLTRELDGSHSNPRMAWHRREAVFVRVRDEDGAEGWGECWTFDRSAAALLAFIETEVVPLVVHRPFATIEAVHDAIRDTAILSGRHGMAAAAASGVDLALHDLAARRAGQPLASWLGSGRRRVAVYASGGLYAKGKGVAELAAEMRGYRERGFTTVKMKIGRLGFAEDRARLEAVREAIGSAATLLVDAVYSLEPERARRWLPVFRAVGVLAIQAPFPPDRWAEMASLNRELPVMAWDAEVRPEIYRAALAAGAIGVMLLAPTAVGGVTGTRRLLAMAADAGVPASLHCSSTGFAELAAFHLAAALPAIRDVEYHQFHTMLYDRLPPAVLTVENGTVTVPDVAGIGMAVPA